LSINNSTLTNDGGVTSYDTNDAFGAVYLYDKADANLSNAVYHNGKLSAVKWMSLDASGNKSHERAYLYSYDGMNRYTASTYEERVTAGTGAFSSNLHGFDESGITYDMNGNIKTLARNSSTQGTNSNVQIDNLNYTYNSTIPDQLYAVSDGTTANYTGAGFRNLTGSTGNYTYDSNGNLKTDPYKGLSLTYDYLNRTDKITVTTGTNQYINYTYDAAGNLIRKQQYNSGTLQTTTDYIDGFVYITAGAGTPALAYFPMPEGRVMNTGTGGTVTLAQEFIITDQQGNARVSFRNVSGAAVVYQENSYYGFGLILPNSPVGTTVTSNKQLYNGGSEWQNDYTNLPDYYQTYYRNYDAALARWVGVDPIAEGAGSMSTYQYSGNNPIMYNDPLGNLIDPNKQSHPAGGASPNLNPGSYGGGLDNGVLDQEEGDIPGNDGQGSDQGFGGFDASTAADNALSAQSDYQNDIVGDNGRDAQNAAEMARNAAGLVPGGNPNNAAATINSIVQPYASQFALGSVSFTPGRGLEIFYTVTTYTFDQNGNPSSYTGTGYTQHLPTYFGSDGSWGDNSESSWDAVNNGISAFGIGNGVKGSMIAAAINSGETATLALKTYGKVTDALGVAGGLVAMGSSGYNMYNQYQQNHQISDIHIGDVGDFTVGAASVGATVFLATNPVGWAIGVGAAVYFTGRFIYQETHQ
jgi:RHS repeat-associated protein